MTTDGYFGLLGIPDGFGNFNSIQFQIEQLLRQLRTSIPVKVVAVHGGGDAAAPTVDVQPLVNQVDGVGNRTPHGVIYGIPCTRNQGGGNAIINDPAVDDVGLLTVSDRDISALKAAAGKASNPGSRRRHNLSDGVYVGAMLNPAGPSQAVQFTATGVKIFDANGNVIEMKNGGIYVTGTIYATGDIVAGYGGADQVGLQTHTHTDAQGGTVSSPNAGS